MNVYVHFIDQDFNVSNFLLEQELFPQPHDYKSISSKLDEVFFRYGIQKKIKSITSDNASNMVKAMKLLVKYYKEKFNLNIIHLRCAAHILHLICGEFMKIEIVIVLFASNTIYLKIF